MPTFAGNVVTLLVDEASVENFDFLMSEFDIHLDGLGERAAERIKRFCRSITDPLRLELDSTDGATATYRVEPSKALANAMAAARTGDLDLLVVD